VRALKAKYGKGITDVKELPTENIDEATVYRIKEPEATVYMTNVDIGCISFKEYGELIG
jgi:hypothetical protein